MLIFSGGSPAFPDRWLIARELSRESMSSGRRTHSTEVGSDAVATVLTEVSVDMSLDDVSSDKNLNKCFKDLVKQGPDQGITLFVRSKLSLSYGPTWDTLEIDCLNLGQLVLLTFACFLHLSRILVTDSRLRWPSLV